MCQDEGRTDGRAGDVQKNNTGQRIGSARFATHQKFCLYAVFKRRSDFALRLEPNIWPGKMPNIWPYPDLW